jgi:hypothetical protein
MGADSPQLAGRLPDCARIGHADGFPGGLARAPCQVSFHRPTRRADARMSDSGWSSCRPGARRDNRTLKAGTSHQSWQPPATGVGQLKIP